MAWSRHNGGSALPDKYAFLWEAYYAVREEALIFLPRPHPQFPQSAPSGLFTIKIHTRVLSIVPLSKKMDRPRSREGLEAAHALVSQGDQFHAVILVFDNHISNHPQPAVGSLI